MVTIQNIPVGPVISSSLSEVTIEADNDYIEFSLCDASENNILFHEKLWTFEGLAKIYNLNEIIENYMRSKAVSYIRVKMTAQYQDLKDEGVIEILYCEHFNLSDSDISSFISQNFLTSLQTRRIAPDAVFKLYLYSKDKVKDNFVIQILYSTSGEDHVRSCSLQGSPSEISDKFLSIEINLAGIIDTAAKDANTVGSAIDIKSFSVSCASRYAVFFVDKSLQYGETFIFRNIFNAIDAITVPALTKSKVDVERSVAVLPGKAAFYDRVVTKSYELQSGPLSTEEADLMEQLVAAHDVFRLIPVGLNNGVVQYAVKEILITDSEISNANDDETQSVKFTWRFADNRPPVLLADPYRIFSSDYNKVFS